MAITATSLTASFDGDGGNGTTASISPQSGALLLVFVASGDDSTASISGLGLTWNLAVAHQRGTSAQHGSIWWADAGASPGSGSLTITATTAFSNVAWDVVEVMGANNSSPIVQAVDGGESTTDAFSISAFADAANVGFAHTVINSSSQTIAASGGTDLGAQQNDGSPSIGHRAQYTAANDNSFAWTVSGTPIPTMAGIEVAVATVVVHNAAATMDGTGDLTATGRQTFMAAATMTGTGDLSAVGRQTFMASATLTGTGDLEATGGFIIAASALLDGTGALTAAAVREHQAVAALDGQGDLAAAAVRVAVAAALMTGTGDLSATPFVPATLTNRILNPSGTAVDGVKVTIKVKPQGAQPDSGVVGNTETVVYSDSSGDWTADLVGNDRIDYEGSTYIVTQRLPDGTEQTWKVELTNGVSQTLAESLA